MHNNMSHNTSTILQQRSHTTTQACAACKYQRRKCAPDCILAPYFPHERHHQFLNAHKLFGVSNIIKIIRPLDQQSKDDAMRTIIFQSDVRASDPVGGCYRIICSLERQINVAKAELEIVLHHLALCRAQVATAAQQQATLQAVEDADSSLNCDCDVINGDPLGSFEESMNNYHQSYQHPQQLEHDQYIDHKQLALQEINAWGCNEPESTSSFPVIRRTLVDECEDIKSILELQGDDREKFKFHPADENRESGFITLA